MHYQRWRRNSDPLISGDEPRPCSTEECDKNSEARGLCYTHYKAWQRSNDYWRSKEIEAISDRALVRKYGITRLEYNRMLQGQKGVCAICKKACKSGWRLAVDHCHKTGQVRKLLCGQCNMGLGAFRDNPDLLIAAAQYLFTHQIEAAVS